MDIIKPEDQSDFTEALGDKHKELKTEKKKSESKKLKKKLIVIEEQNESLAKIVSEKSTEILELKKSINSLNEVLNSVPINELRHNSSIVNARLLDLSKKNRQLRAELESTKNRLSKKDQQVQRLEKDLQKCEEKLQQSNENSKDSSPAYIEDMQGKLSALQQKLFETRNKNVELNTQLKLAQKCLQQEIGESFNLNLLANQANISNWRGRAQQIIHLQQKIKEMQERLDGNQYNEISNGQIYCFSDHSLSSSASLGSFERPNVRKTEIQHRAKVENLEKEIVNLKTQIADQSSKMLALKVRNKTLNDEISRHKLKANSLEEQKDFNDFNVAAMQEKLSQQKSQYEKLLDRNSRETERVCKEMQEVKLIKEHLEQEIMELQGSILKKNDSIDELNLQLKQLREDLRAISGDFLFSCREFRKEEFISILDSLETEKNSLLDLNKTLSERLTQERLKNDNLFEQTSKQKIRISRLEAKLRDLETEIEVQTEKKKRTQRIAEYTANLCTKSSTSSIGTFTFENSSLSVALNNNYSNSEQQSDENFNDVKYRLELAAEKITMLNEKLDYLSAERENDAKTFHEIISNSKNVLVEMILNHQRQNNTRNDDGEL